MVSILFDLSVVYNQKYNVFRERNLVTAIAYVIGGNSALKDPI